jgi:hypothetical protein
MGGCCLLLVVHYAYVRTRQHLRARATQSGPAEPSRLAPPPRPPRSRRPILLTAGFVYVSLAAGALADHYLGRVESRPTSTAAVFLALSVVGVLAARYRTGLIATVLISLGLQAAFRMSLVGLDLWRGDGAAPSRSYQDWANLLFCHTASFHPAPTVVAQQLTTLGIATPPVSSPSGFGAAMSDIGHGLISGGSSTIVLLAVHIGTAVAAGVALCLTGPVRAWFPRRTRVTSAIRPINGLDRVRSNAVS